ncbi:MAG: cadherin domain-containing protein [Cyclobacteriaceae bacterium]
MTKQLHLKILLCNVLLFSLCTLNANPSISVSNGGAAFTSGDSFDYNDVIIGDSASNYFIITNTGTTDLTLAATNAITLSGLYDEFILDTDLSGSVLAPDDTVVFGLKFKPEMLSTYGVTLSIVSDDPDDNPFFLNITATSKFSPGECFLHDFGSSEYSVHSIPNYGVLGLGDFDGLIKYTTPLGWKPYTSLAFAQLLGTEVNVSYINGLRLHSRSGLYQGFADVATTIYCGSSPTAFEGKYKMNGSVADTAFIIVSSGGYGSQTDANTDTLWITSDKSVYTDFSLDIPYDANSGDSIFMSFYMTTNGTVTDFYANELALVGADVGSSPSNLSLDYDTISENKPTGTLVGTFIATDADNDVSHFKLAFGSTTYFDLFNDGKLYTLQELNHESFNGNITVEVYDSGGHVYEEDFVIKVVDIAESPTNIILSEKFLNESFNKGTEVGQLLPEDEDDVNSFTFSLVDGEGDSDNDRFSITGDKLYTNDQFDAETEDSLSIRVHVNNDDLFEIDTTIIIRVSDNYDLHDGTASDLGEFIAGEELLHGVAVDSFGNIYTSVYIDDEVSFGDSTYTQEDVLVVYDTEKNLQYSRPGIFPKLQIDSANIYHLHNGKLNKLDSLGEEMWSVLPSSLQTSSIYFKPSIQGFKLLDDGIIVAGRDAYSSALIIAKYGYDGEFLWSKPLALSNTSYSLLFRDIAVNESHIALSVTMSPTSLTQNGVTVTNSSGKYSAALLVLNEDGELLWGESFHHGISSLTAAGDVAFDETGNVYVSGAFKGVISFDGNSLGSPGEGFASYYAKYTPDGTYSYSRSIADANESLVFQNLVTTSDSVYLFGYEQETKASYIRSYHHDGTFGTFQSILGAHVTSKEMVLGPDDELIISGHFTDGSLTFGSDDSEVSGDDGFGQDAFVASFSDIHTDEFGLFFQSKGGNYFWADVDLGPDNKTYVVGQLSGQVEFDDQPYESGGDDDILVGCFSADGSLDWIKRFGQSGNQRGLKLEVLESGDIYIFGSYDRQFQFDGSIPVFNYTDNVDNYFMAKLETNGTISWKQEFWNLDDYFLELDSDEDIIIAGNFEDSTVVDGLVLKATGDDDGFVTKVTTAGVVDWTKQTDVIAEMDVYLDDVYYFSESALIKLNADGTVVATNADDFTFGDHEPLAMEVNSSGVSMLNYVEYTSGSFKYLQEYDFDLELQYSNETANSYYSFEGKGDFFIGYNTNNILELYSKDISLLNSYSAHVANFDISDNADTIVFIPGSNSKSFKYVTINEGPEDFKIDEKGWDEDSLGFHGLIDFEGDLTFSLEVGSGTVELEQDSLFIIGATNFEMDSTIDLRIRAYDSFGGTISRSFEIGVNDIPEHPTDISAVTIPLSEMNAAGKAAFALSTSDEDLNESFTYQLVKNSSYPLDSLFFVDGDSIRVNQTLNYEDFSLGGTSIFLTIEVQVTDKDGLSRSETLSVRLNNVNESPGGVMLETDTIDENLSSLVISNLEVEDPDGSAFQKSVTYTLVDGTGSDDNDKFHVSGNQLRRNNTFNPNFEEDSLLHIRILVDDSQDAYAGVESMRQIVVRDLNEHPISDDVTLSNDTIKENSPVGTVIGIVQIEDEDFNEIYSLSLTSTTDSIYFYLDGDTLKSNKEEDFEGLLNSGYKRLVSIKYDDGRGYARTKSFDIHIENVPEGPSEIYAKDHRAGTKDAIGENDVDYISLVALDADKGAIPHKYGFQLVVGDGDDDNDEFTIDGYNLTRNAGVFNFEEDSIYNIRVKVSDSLSDISIEVPLVFRVLDESESISGWTLDGVRIDTSKIEMFENLAVGTSLGKIAVVDEDYGDEYVITVDDFWANEFEVDNDQQLRVKKVFDKEGVQPTNQVVMLIASKVNSSETYTRNISIEVLDVNEAPRIESLSATAQVQENLIGDGFYTYGFDPEYDNISYSLVEGEGDDYNDYFSFDQGSNWLSTVDSLNYEQASQVTIRVRLSDSLENNADSVLTIAVSDVNEAPRNLVLSNAEVNENEEFGTVVGTLSAMDEDAGDSYYFEFNNNEFNDNNKFSIQDSSLITNTIFDYETDSIYEVHVVAIDNSGFNSEVRRFIVRVLNVDEGFELSNNRVDENAGATNIGTLTSTVSGMTYSLVAGEGDINNASFEIVGDQLNSLESFNYEESDSLSVRVEGVSAEGSIVEILTILVTDVNEVITDVSLSNMLIQENLDSGTEVGTVIIEDEDEDDSYTISVTSDENFTILAGALVSTRLFNYERERTVSVEVTVSDEAGHAMTKTFEIAIENDPSDDDSEQDLAGVDNILLNIHPNPTMQFINVLDGVSRKSTYQVLDVSGKLYLSGKLDQKRIDVSNLNHGVYLIKVIDDQKHFSARFIKQ